MANSATHRRSINFRNIPPKLTKLFEKRTSPGGGIPGRGKSNRRIIATGDGVYLHATKGYRRGDIAMPETPKEEQS